MNYDEIKEKISSEKNHNFDSLTAIVDLLRSRDGCPWDREQDHKSIRKNLIEETYEVVEAIDCNDAELLKEELGDLILQAVFHAQIEKELKNFSIDDVIQGICDKLIRRHPHIFTDSDKLLRKDGHIIYDWDDIKKAEKESDKPKKFFNIIPPSLPALMKADKVYHKYYSKIGQSPVNSEALKREFMDFVDSLENGSDNKGKTYLSAGDLLLHLSLLLIYHGVDCEKELSDSITYFLNENSN